MRRMKIHALNRGSGGAIKDDDTLRQQTAEYFNSFGGSGHQYIRASQVGLVELLDYPMGSLVAIWYSRPRHFADRNCFVSARSLLEGAL
jgi:hypothetical protein